MSRIVIDQQYILDLITKDETTGCWLWTRPLKPNGYGSAYLPTNGWRLTKTVYAHRLAYELFVGAIPDGKQLDHLCRVRHCVNPAHLEPVMAKQNQQRGKRAQQTHCLRGHLLSGSNLRMKSNGTRACRACDVYHESRRA
jgi:hypothetical protein